MVEPHSSNFRVITTNFLGVRIFRKFTVLRVNSLKFRTSKKKEHMEVTNFAKGGNLIASLCKIGYLSDTEFLVFSFSKLRFYCTNF